MDSDEAIAIRIYRALVAAGDMTSAEIGARLDLHAHTVGKRVSELRLRQLVVDSGKRRVSRDTGRRIIVWQAVPGQWEVS